MSTVQLFVAAIVVVIIVSAVLAYILHDLGPPYPYLKSPPGGFVQRERGKDWIEVRADAVMPTLPRTWEEIERLALHDAVLHQLVHMVRAGATKEEALIAAVLLLSHDCEYLRNRLAEKLSNAPFSVLLDKPPRGEG